MYKKNTTPAVQAARSQKEIVLPSKIYILIVIISPSRNELALNEPCFFGVCNWGVTKIKLSRFAQEGV